MYYGTEQLPVSNSSDNRVSMWPHYGATELSAFLGQLNRVRSEYGLSHGGANVTLPGKVVHAEAHTMAFLRGRLLVTKGPSSDL